MSKQAATTHYYCADFETNTTPESVMEHPVWLWAFAPVGAFEEAHVWTGNDIESFMARAEHVANRTLGAVVVYFHNLKFDGNFIIPQLFLDGYYYVDKIPFKASEREPKTFNVLRSKQGAFYTITVVLESGKIVTFRDSLKIITGSIRKMPYMFGFADELQKLSFAEEDYKRIRPKGYEPNAAELAYCKHDVLVLCRALQELYSGGFDFDCLTTGSYAWKNVCKYLGGNGSNRFRQAMFSLEDDEWLFAREAYAGGITICNPAYAGRVIEQAGRTDDVNSMYPTVMRYYPLPYGKGQYGTGCPLGVEYMTASGQKTRKHNEGTLWIARLRCHMVLKEGQMAIYTPKSCSPENPFIPLWTRGERVTDTHERSKDPIEIVLTSVDWENLNHHYEFQDVEWVEYYTYPSRSDLFADYVDRFIAQKVENKKAGIPGKVYTAKLCLNSAYGKLGQRTYCDELTPYIDEEGVLKWRDKIDLGKSPVKHGRPMHMAAFITAWARHILCKHIRAVGERFCYADTDSVHYLGTEAPEGVKIDPYELGAWDNESKWTRAAFIRPKAYYEIFEDGTRNIKLAGCPSSLLQDVEIEDFNVGLTLHGKKRPVLYPRGVILEDTDYTFSDKPGWGC